MTAPPLIGRVQRHWRTQAGLDGCILLVNEIEHRLTAPRGLPPVLKGAQLQVTVEAGEIVTAERLVTETEIAWAFYSRLPGPAARNVIKVVHALGDQTHELVQGPHGLLSGISGCTPSLLKAMRDYARKEGRLYTTLRALADLGLPPEHARRLVKVHGAGAVRRFEEDPYAGVQYGIALSVLDYAARQQGLSLFDPRRGPALAYEIVRLACQEHGHTCLPLPVLYGELRDLHALEDDEATDAVARAFQAGSLKEALGAAYLPDQLRLESRLADDVIRLVLSTPTPVRPLLPPHLTDEQGAAVTLGCQSTLCIITGGPGTGKTTTLKALLDSLEAAGLETLLCAPTGKAASRMSQSTEREATTLHRILGYDGAAYTGGSIQADVVVVDEVSMASNELLSQLLRVVPDATRVILVGDEDQLPPIDAGHPLAALIQTLPTARLTKTHRQAQGSPILKLAGMLISGEAPVNTGVPFHAAEVTHQIVDLVQAHLTPQGPPMVLTAGKAGPLGVDALNLALQAALNPGTGRLRVGDPVMATRNNHETGLMNGMTGRVTEIGKKLRCLFDDVPYEFSAEEAAQLALAYAMTIHRSQGSEWPAVIVVLAAAHQRLLSRQLAYTAVTRAKSVLVASGERAAWTYCAQTNAPYRNSMLERFLRL
ncbi:AAA family ATPase [Deinococcus gobiensis]|uniref:Helicase RecD/TraA n=1 Tax=Deinococcus gobiensis (strain DSM 21396 / JCM 16679 / CGMCC 1.7299 / I-0) TaxID=745776 RepID=H8H1M9_DEIGI|nr:AAA family ATPase [Deinococcus gobiensis]AFD27426.1 Helicase RecD/TraA [Deinococcus gobiensis I-0]